MKLFNNKQTPIGLLLVLVLVLAICPRRIKDMYETVLGRILLISITTFCALHNVLLGLLVVLILIISSNMFLFEGFKEGLETGTTETETTPTPTPTPTPTQTPTNESVKVTAEAVCIGDGCDRQTLTDALKSLDSNTISINIPETSSVEVEPSIDGFTSMQSRV